MNYESISARETWDFFSVIIHYSKLILMEQNLHFSSTRGQNNSLKFTFKIETVVVLCSTKNRKGEGVVYWHQPSRKKKQTHT